MRIQKVLSAAGVASRRQVEAWLVQGRLTVNGKEAVPGQALGPKDVVALDGRRLRLAATSPNRTRVIAYHRSPGEPARAADAPEGTTPVEDRLPKVKGARWLPLGAMAPSDGGLELFTTDGALRAAVSKQAGAHETHYAVRVRRLPEDDELAKLAPTAAAGEPPFEVLKCGAEPGEGSNAWINVTTRGARARDLRAALAAIGVDVGRLLRTQFLGFSMPRNLMRGRSVELDDDEVAALCASVDYAGLAGSWQSNEPPVTPRAAGPRRKR